jgi:hypothetical protein
MPDEIADLAKSSASTTIQATAKLTLFPTKWDSETQISEESFNPVPRALSASGQNQFPR